MKTIALATLLALVYTTAHAQDPVKVSPQYYKVLLENDQVRVLEYRLKAGEKEPMHSHPAGVVYVLGGAKLKMSHPEGKTEESAAAPGETFWRNPTTHAIENVGDTEAHAIAIDLKSPGSPSETTNPTNSSPDEQRLWELERSYWRYVEANDLAAYSNLWHNDFLGWPSVSAMPVRKDHITDWITSQTSKGLAFKAGELKPAGVQAKGDVAMVYYRITFRWLDKDGNGPANTLRITHTWLETGNDWRIAGGMSMPEPK
jgi:quercetin dioxygenase-like cupin family protein/ketosteroid isomerase-like protein